MEIMERKGITIMSFWDETTHHDSLSWNTRQELQFLEAVWAGNLQVPSGIIFLDSMTILRGYAQSFRDRVRWGNIDRDAIERWLAAHGFEKIIGHFRLN